MKVIRKLSSWTGQFNNFWPFSFWQFSAAVLPHQEIFSVCCKKRLHVHPLVEAAGGLTLIEPEALSRFLRVRRALRDANRNKRIWRLPIRFRIILLFLSFLYWWCFGVELLRGEGVFTENTIQVVEAPPQVAEVWISKTGSLSSGRGQTCKKNQYSHKSRIKVVSHKSCIESGWIEFLFTIYKSSRKGAQSRVVWDSVHCQEYCPVNTIFNSSSSFYKMEWLIDLNSIWMAKRSEFNFRSSSTCLLIRDHRAALGAVRHPPVDHRNINLFN